MNKIEPSFYFVEQSPGVLGMNKMWEFAARLCYRSEDKITEESYKKIYKILDNGKHQSPFAHATCYMTMPVGEYLYFLDGLESEDYTPGSTKADYWRTPAWTRVIFSYNLGNVYITTNYRVLRELGIEDLYEEFGIDKPTSMHIKRYSVLITADIGVTRELNRHAIALAINEQSTRYCDFSKEKHGGVTYINSSDNLIQQEANENAEKAYMALLAEGKPPQEARRALNLNTASMALYTGFPDMWEHVLELRTSSGAHPDMKELMIPLYQEFKDKGILN